MFLSVFCEALINMDVLKHQVSERLVLGRFSAPVVFSALLEEAAGPFAHGAAPE